jgi:hypothetical protein
VGKTNGSGYTKLINIINADVIDNQAVIKTGAVERYFKKLFIINYTCKIFF